MASAEQQPAALPERTSEEVSVSQPIKSSDMALETPGLSGVVARAFERAINDGASDLEMETGYKPVDYTNAGVDNRSAVETGLAI